MANTGGSRSSESSSNTIDADGITSQCNSEGERQRSQCRGSSLSNRLQTKQTISSLGDSGSYAVVLKSNPDADRSNSDFSER